MPKIEVSDRAEKLIKKLSKREDKTEAEIVDNIINRSYKALKFSRDIIKNH